MLLHLGTVGAAGDAGSEGALTALLGPGARHGASAAWGRGPPGGVPHLLGTACFAIDRRRACDLRSQSAVFENFLERTTPLGEGGALAGRGPSLSYGISLLILRSAGLFAGVAQGGGAVFPLAFIVCLGVGARSCR